MATGFPTKSNWAAGDVLTAAQMDDLAGTVNLLSPVGATSGYVLTANGTSTPVYAAITTGAAAAGTLTGTTLASNVVNSSLTTFGTAPQINLGYSAKTAAYTTVLADNGYLLSMNNAATQAFSIPTNASVAYPIGTQINFVWITGAGQPTIQAVTSGTTTILSTGATSNTPKLRAVNSVASCIKIATDTWIVTGDIA
jgi:hypothetical protein